jgi:hypothetical protein
MINLTFSSVFISNDGGDVSIGRGISYVSGSGIEYSFSMGIVSSGTGSLHGNS